ncbi:GntR family transcriptional regulator [Marinilongibacter aquaticus]|uniref:CvfB family protein n=1 Tax=Marinilongibacter aquaticus TaxID=2975157 RepID=UPI0021BDB5DD|nr:S1-like domain-containing RNA-binding protein [Marinilongibacter aquaticus]UBM58059.1 GntR family transcriptional regulator [Marinilongibacter aquaticus]
MLRNGEYNTLTILRGTSVGFYLGDEEGNDVLLPHKYIPENAEVGQQIEVFIYRDSEDRLIATTLKPLIDLNTFACLHVSGASRFGAFVDIGLEKELLIPFKEQHQKLREGDYAVVYLYLDEQTDRLVGSVKVNKFLETEEIDLEEGEEVEVLLYEKSDLGYNVIVNNRYRGLIYENEIFQRVAWGEKHWAFVKLIRDDGKIDISLQQQGFANVEPNARKILNMLEQNNGELPFSDKSDPIAIQAEFEMSKKTFKKAIGTLYKQKHILIESEGIRLIKDK